MPRGRRYRETLDQAALTAKLNLTVARAVPSFDKLWRDVCALLVGTDVDSTGCSCETVEMKNITVCVDEEVHRRARIKAAERDTSVSAVVREFLVRWSGEETEFERRRRLQNETLDSIDNFRAGNRLRREDIHRRGHLR